MSKASAQRIEEAKKKAISLLEQNRRLLLKNGELEGEVKKLQLDLDRETLKSAELLNKIKIIKLAQNISVPATENADITELKRKINEYIKEIDHCITMLND